MLIGEEVTRRVIGAAIEVHRALGPGLLESAYEEWLFYELGVQGIRCERQVEVPVLYKDMEVAKAFRADLIVDQTVLLELKSVDRIERIHESQLLTYLRLTRLRVGLILNFNTTTLKEGIVRRVL
jgi:GxxExxY protein